MVEKRDCSFCGRGIEPGTGMMYIRRDGTRHEFCSSKCRRNLLDLKRVPRTVKWTKKYVKGAGKAVPVMARAEPTNGGEEPGEAKPRGKAKAPKAKVTEATEATEVPEPAAAAKSSE